MSEAQYEVIKETYPIWAKTVEEITMAYVVTSKAGSPSERYYDGFMRGLASAAVRLQCIGDAPEFVSEALRKAVIRYEGD